VSLRVLVVPEDPTYNGAILQPLVARMIENCGRSNPKVTVLTNPKTTGYDHAKALLPDIVERYSHFSFLLFLVDADGKDRRDEFDQLESDADQRGVALFCCAAEQEIEVWLLAGHTDKLRQGWREIRADVSVKEHVFEPFLHAYGDTRRASGGRDVLMRDTLANYSGLLERCPELARLESRLQNFLQSQFDGDS